MGLVQAIDDLAANGTSLDAALFTGLDSAMISRYERGTRKPPSERHRMLALCVVFVSYGAIENLDQANQFLTAADKSPFTDAE